MKSMIRKSLGIVVIAALVVVAFFVTSHKVYAADIVDSGTCGADLTWTLDSDGVMIISGSGDMNDYSYYDRPWIDDLRSIKTVIIQSGVTSIGYGAFHECTKLTSVTIADSVTSIGQIAFADCTDLPNIDLPDSLVSIGYAAFEECTSFTDITIPNSVTSIENTLFQACTNLTNVTIPDSVTSIGSSAFFSCYKLTSITLPDKVTSIGDSAFENSDLERITIPAGVRKIGQNAFHSTKLKYVFYGGTEAQWNALKVDTIGDAVVHYESEDHSYGDLIPESATCTEDGLAAHYKCDVCEALFVMNGDEYVEKTVTELTVAAPGHRWDDDPTVDKPATCVEEGSQSIHCSACGAIDESKVEVIPKTDHTYGDWTVTREATCTEEGSREKDCEVCGNKVTEKIAASGHTPSESVKENEVAATCENGGSYDEVVYCSVCNIEIGRETKNTSAEGHKWNDESTVDKEATCTEDGSKSIHCSVCGVIDESTVEMIPATGHTLVSVKGKEATSTEAGYEAYWKCSVCERLFSDAEGKNEISEPIVIDPTGPTQEEIERTEALDNLSNAITDAKAVSNTDNKYTPESFKALQDAIANAESVAANENATAAELNAAKAAVETAKAGLAENSSGTDPVDPQPTPVDPTPTPAPAVTPTPVAPAEIVDLPAVRISKPKAAKKKITVKWKKVSKKNLKKIQGIEIQVATDPGFTNIVKTATAGKKKTSKVIKGLTSKQTYYVRIRVYKDAADGKHVSAWKAKKAKVK